MALCAAGLALALAGCEVRAEISVNDDGSGTAGFVYGLEPLFFGTLPSDSNPLVDVKKELESSSIPWDVTTFKEPGLQGIRATVPFANVDEFRELMKVQSSEPLDAFGAGRSGGFTDNMVLQKIDGGWSLRATGEPPGAAFGGGGSEGGVQLPELSMPGADIDKLMRFEFHVTMPGDAGGHNADQVEQDDGRTTFIWRLGFFDTNAIDLRAATVPAGAGFPFVPALFVIAMLVGGAVFGRRRMPRSGAPPVVLEGLPAASPGIEADRRPVQPSLLADMGFDDMDTAVAPATNGVATLVMPAEDDEPPFNRRA